MEREEARDFKCLGGRCDHARLADCITAFDTRLAARPTPAPEAREVVWATCPSCDGVDRHDGPKGVSQGCEAFELAWVQRHPYTVDGDALAKANTEIEQLRATPPGSEALANAIQNACGEAIITDEGTVIPCDLWAKIVRLAKKLHDVTHAPTPERVCPSCKRSYTTIEFSLGAGWVCNHCKPRPAPDTRCKTCGHPASYHSKWQCEEDWCACRQYVAPDASAAGGE